MSSHDEWRSIIASALDWDQAHAKFDSAVEGLAPELRAQEERLRKQIGSTR